MKFAQQVQIPFMKQRYRIGSKPDNDIHLPSQYVDGYHAVVFMQGGEWYIEDLRSKFGTFIGQIKVETPLPIPPNTLIRIGTEKLNLEQYLMMEQEEDEEAITRQNLLKLEIGVGQKTYRAITLLAIFSPAIVYFGLHLINRFQAFFTQTLITDEALSRFWMLPMVIVSALFLIITLKRWNDTGKPLWKFFIPIYNLFVLFFSKSKPRTNSDN
jgi:pSer/pThr/pTyr-binding forkhead associated (FHA) protein